MLRKSAAIYINSDSNGRGFLGVGGSHTLEKFINEVSRDVSDPEKKISVSDRARAVQLLRGDKDERREARDRADLRIDALGSGSDFTPFLQHLGIASLNLGFGGEDGGGSYHSIYDSFDNYTRFIDPNFDYGIALAEVGGRTVLRFANADVLPFEFGNLSDTVGQYVKEVAKLTDDAREEVKEKNRRLSDGTYAAVFDPTQPFVMPQAEQPVPYLNFAPLENSLARLQESTRKYQTKMRQLAAQNKLPAQPAASDEALIKVERAMTRDEGLPRRSWFKHQIYAPGFYTGYGVKTLPGVREAIEQHNWQEANEQIGIVSQTIENVAAEIDRATALLQGNQ
jgi:N-acetylated-alpha-linked acidic dipeptidase